MAEVQSMSETPPAISPEKLQERVVTNTMTPYAAAINTILSVVATACVYGILYSVGSNAPGEKLRLGALGNVCALVLPVVLTINQVVSVSFADRDKWLPSAASIMGAMVCMLSLAVVGALGRSSQLTATFSFLVLALGMTAYAATTPWWILGDYSHTRSAWSFTGLVVGVITAGCAAWVPMSQLQSGAGLALLGAGFSLFLVGQIIPAGYSHVKSLQSVEVNTMEVADAEEEEE